MDTRIYMSSNVKKVDASECINKLEDLLAQEQQIPLEFGHIFSGGMYARTVLIPQGTICTGLVHKSEHLNILAKGKCIVFTTDTQSEQKEAPCIFSAKAGVKKAVYALEDVLWTTIHVCTSTTVTEAEIEVAEPPRKHIQEAHECVQAGTHITHISKQMMEK